MVYAHCSLKPINDFSNGVKGLLLCLLDFTILDRWVFNNFILANELFIETFRSIGTRLMVSNIYVESQSGYYNGQSCLMNDLNKIFQ